MHKTNMWLAAALMAVFAFGTLSCGSREEKVEDVVSLEGDRADSIEMTLGFCPDSMKTTEGEVRSGQFFSSLLTGLGMSQKEAYDLTESCDSVFDVRTLRVGNSYREHYLPAEDGLQAP